MYLIFFSLTHAYVFFSIIYNVSLTCIYPHFIVQLLFLLDGLISLSEATVLVDIQKSQFLIYLIKACLYVYYVILIRSHCTAVLNLEQQKPSCVYSDMHSIISCDKINLKCRTFLLKWLNFIKRIEKRRFCFIRVSSGMA